jgi:secreted PhoX family phosphatase
MSIAKYSSQPVLSIRQRASHKAMHDAMSRRHFLQAATGATALGTTLAGSLLSPPAAAAQGIGNVLPITSTLNFFGVDLHIQAPPFSGVDTDPSTVWNFQGSSAIAFIDTTATRTNRKTGAVRNLDSLFNHMTFMKGIYRGRDGHVREGTFSLV